MKQSIRGLRANIEQLAGERERAENDSLEHTRRWQERAEALKSQGVQVGLLSRGFFLVLLYVFSFLFMFLLFFFHVFRHHFSTSSGACHGKGAPRFFFF